MPHCMKSTFYLPYNNYLDECILVKHLVNNLNLMQELGFMYSQARYEWRIWPHLTLRTL